MTWKRWSLPAWLPQFLCSRLGHQPAINSGLGGWYCAVCSYGLPTKRDIQALSKQVDEFVVAKQRSKP